MTDKEKITALSVATVLLAIAATYFGIDDYQTNKDVKTIVKNNTIANWTDITDARKKRYLAK